MASGMSSYPELQAQNTENITIARYDMITKIAVATLKLIGQIVVATPALLGIVLTVIYFGQSGPFVGQ